MDQKSEKGNVKLSPEQYHVCREGGTEPPFSGKLLHNHATGQYLCVCCGNILFNSNTKFDSGSGWPSFWQANTSTAVTAIKDIRHGMIRTEIRCANCDVHLGHVFEDGPTPTGLRYCINSISLKFEPENKKMD